MARNKPRARPASLRRPGDGALAALLGIGIFAAAAFGATAEELVQDTLKSAIVAFAALGAGAVFFVLRARDRQPLRWHAALLLPLALMAYALASMAWSHTYLAGVEAIRWFVFTLLMFVALNVLTPAELPKLAWGLAGGASVASLWAALQFLFGFSFFPQGPHPASTFVNRNFFAEFAVCALPFIFVLLARARRAAMVAALSFAAGLVVLAICMTGARAALVAMWLQLLVLVPLAAGRYRSALAWPSWPPALRQMSVGIVLAMVVGVGAIPTTDRSLIAEGKGTTALARATARTASISTQDASFAIRANMWHATGEMIAAHPVAGVGAGAWENEIPRYQTDGALLETDFYVHNEFLQLVAEYGVVGWLFLAGLFAWLARAAWQAHRSQDSGDAAWRVALLASLFSLFVVSNVGFPWRLAATGALFAVGLGGLAAADMRPATVTQRWWGAVAIRPRALHVATATVVAAIGLAGFITWQAVESERLIVRATRLAITISASGDPDSPRWDSAKAEMLEKIHQGVKINPHYRKITPIVADEMARWGDWVDAIPIWDSVLSSRPYVVAILTNVARGYMAIGMPERAAEYIERARAVQPQARSVRSAEVGLLARTGQDARAMDAGRKALDEGSYDFDLANALFVVARRNGNFALAERAMLLRLEGWEQGRAQGWTDLATMYESDMHDSAKALEARKHALSLASPQRSASKG